MHRLELLQDVDELPAFRSHRRSGRRDEKDSQRSAPKVQADVTARRFSRWPFFSLRTTSKISIAWCFGLTP